MPTYAFRYYAAGTGRYLGSEFIVRPRSSVHSRKVKAPTLLAAARKLRRVVRARMVEFDRLDLWAAWMWDETDYRWRLIADHRTRWGLD